MLEQEVGLPYSQREEDRERESLEQRAHLVNCMNAQGDPRPHTTITQMGPPEQRVPQAHGIQ